MADSPKSSQDGQFYQGHWSRSRWEEISSRAYARWVQRGRPQGTELEDWLQAEVELGRMEEVLRDRETRLRLILDQLPAILWTTDQSLRITSSTGTGLKELNLEPNQPLGQSLYEFFQTKNPEFPPLAAHLRALNGQTSSYEQTWMGQTFQVHVETLRDRQGHVSGCIGLALNITRRKQAEEALRQAHENLNQRVAQRTQELDQANTALEKLLEERLVDLQARQRQNIILQAILDGTTDAVFVKDLQGRYLLINQAGANFLGRPIEEILGKDDGALFSADTAANIQASDQRVLETGRTQTFEELGTAGGVTRIYHATKGLLQDGGGNAMGLFGISRDITDRKKVEHRLAAEHAVARALAEATDLAEAVPRIIQALCQSLDWNAGAIWSLDPQLQVLSCQGFWHRPENPVPEFEAISRTLALPPGIGLIGRVWKTGKPVWLRDVAQEGLYLRGPEAALRGLHGALAVPIRFQDAELAVMELYSAKIRNPDHELLETLSLIGSQIAQFLVHRQAQALNNERESELRVARRIQLSLLPRKAPQLAGFDISGASRPANETGGDYYDFLTLPDGGLGVVIGDASGHGVPAALLITQTRAYLRTFAAGHGPFEQILPQTNRCLADGTTGDWFVTLLLARLDPQTRCLSYCSAGHPSGIVLDGGNRIKARLTSTAPPLGIFPDNDFPLGQANSLEPGDLVVLVTDGILETQVEEGSYLGIDGFLQMVVALRARRAAEMVQALLDNVQQLALPGSHSDDMTVVVIKVE